MGFFAVGGASPYYATYVLGDIVARPDHAGQQRHLDRRGAVHPVPGRAVRQEDAVPVRGLFTVVGGVGLFFRPTGIVWPALFFLAIKGVGGSLINTLMFGLEADTVEYGEWKSGKRSEGATYAIFSFTRKLTQSIGGAATAGPWPSAATSRRLPRSPTPSSRRPQSRPSRWSRPRPAAAALLAMIVFITYPLTDQRFREVRDETELRKRRLEHAVLGDHGAI